MKLDVDLRLVWLFMREMSVQGRHALRAYRHLLQIDHRLRELDPFQEPMDFFRSRDALTEEAFLHVHSFLSHAGNVSKILWPPKPLKNHVFSQSERERRAEALRNILHVPDGSPLKPRSFRDDLEHFDERLERWLFSQGASFDVWDMNTFPFGLSSSFGPTDDSARLRGLTAEPYLYSFLDKEVNLEEIADALGDLVKDVHSWFEPASKAGLATTRDITTPTQVYINRPNTEFVPGTEIDAHDAFAAAVETLRAVGICKVSRQPKIESILGYIEQRGWNWSAGNNTRGNFVVRLIQPETNTTYVTQGWSEEEGIVLALATLLREELQENSRPNTLRVDHLGNWTLIRL